MDEPRLNSTSLVLNLTALDCVSPLQVNIVSCFFYIEFYVTTTETFILCVSLNQSAAPNLIWHSVYL